MILRTIKTIMEKIQLDKPGIPLRTVKSWVRRESQLTADEQSDLFESSSYFSDPHKLANLLLSKQGQGIALCLDIGCGDGQSTLQLATEKDHSCVLAIETHTPGLLKIVHEAKKKTLDNILLFHGDILDLLPVLSGIKFSRVHVYFSDPWPKARHHKRRLIQEHFVKNLLSLIDQKGLIHIATDWQPYADHIKECLESITLCQTSDKPYPDAQGYCFKRNPTKYERRGLEKGHKISEFYIQIKREDQL